MSILPTGPAINRYRQFKVGTRLCQTNRRRIRRIIGLDQRAGWRRPRHCGVCDRAQRLSAPGLTTKLVAGSQTPNNWSLRQPPVDYLSLLHLECVT